MVNPSEFMIIMMNGNCRKNIHPLFSVKLDRHADINLSSIAASSRDVRRLCAPFHKI